MPHAHFVHLRVHTAYSLSEGAVRIEELAARCRDERMPAVAMTDSNNLFGAIEFSQACTCAGIQPIIGCQLSISSEEKGANRARSASRSDSFLLLVQNREGYLNLLKLLALAYLKTDADAAAQVYLDNLEGHGEGLIALTGGAAGPIGRLLAEGQEEAAEAVLLRLRDIYPGRLYVELMRHGLDVEKRIEPMLLALAYKHDLPLVATNEAFFSTADMFEAHDALICIAEKAYISQTDRRKLTPEHYLKTAAEMRALFADLPEAVDNTLIIARRCAFMVEPTKPILPPYHCNTGLGEKEELYAQAEKGLEARLQTRVLCPEMTAADQQRASRPYRERLEYELEVIANMEYCGYFLIVADFIRWAQDQDIPVGPGRGSGAGSVVAWALTITDLDPLRWGLLFERFLNPDRVSMPDFDIDFCQERRDEVIRYVQKKYGRHHVAQIITFGKLQARAVLRDVGRVMELPYLQVDRICKLVPNNPAKPTTLDQAIAGEPQLSQMSNEDEIVSCLFGIARRLEGLYRHASTHAAGIVIGHRPLDELIPLYRDPKSDMLVTGFSMKYVEQAGLVKFDFLGLKTLSVLARAAELATKRGEAIDLAAIPLDDQDTFKILGCGETTGVFQLESSGMRDVLKKLKPDTFEDIIAVVALYRPGPMDNIPSYIKRKHGEETIDYLYPTLEGILKETFGIMIYQEQVMQIAQELAGFSLGNADLLRRAMGKKIKKEMNQQRHAFVDGAVSKGVPESKAAGIFEQVAKFAGYGFNKSHAAAYALVAYQTAYMKANYPVEFLAASMTFDMDNTDKLNVYRQELRRLGIAMLPPDINASGTTFTVGTATEIAGGANTAATSGIRYALAAIKNVGKAAMDSMARQRATDGPFRDLPDFCRRIDVHTINKRQLESLIRAGAFDALNGNRQQLFEGVDVLLSHASAATSERESRQIGLFGGGDITVSAFSLPETADWTPLERLRQEFDAMGFYFSAHPLDAYANSLRRLEVKHYAEILEAGVSAPVAMAGTVIGKKERTSSKGNRYAFVQLSDITGQFEVIVFSELLNTARQYLEAGELLFLKTNAQFEGETVRFTAQSMEPLDRVVAKTAPGMKVIIDSAAPLRPLNKILAGEGRGEGDVKLITRLDDGSEAEINLPGGYAITAPLLLKVGNIHGVVGVREI
ncbi:MAG TPA: DNA polymerase III subunit alpha [Rhodospirillales bacterium]|nr:DNA polymerase III subunit alpha [Rhodospirillales bacterium]